MSEFLSEDVRLYQFRNRPNRKIIEILIPKNEDSKSLPLPVRVFYKENGKVDWLNYTLDGKINIEKTKHDSDIILKPQKIPFTHEDIFNLICNGAIFRKDMWNENEFAFITAYIRGQYLLCNGFYSYEALIKEFLYSQDNSLTWHKLEKEV